MTSIVPRREREKASPSAVLASQSGSDNMACCTPHRSRAQQLLSLVLGMTVGRRALRAHRHLENFCELSLARLTLPRFTISLGKCQLHGHILGGHTQPLFEIDNGTLQTPAEHPRYLACDLPKGEVGTPILIVCLQAEHYLYLDPYLLHHLKGLPDALNFA